MQPERLQLSRSIDLGLAFLQGQQRPNGEFPTFVARDSAMTVERRFDSGPFATTYVLHALSFVERPGVGEMATGALDFLESLMEPYGVWRYWPAEHPQHGLIPPDLDDTCCASAALRRFGRTPPANVDLILANRTRAGLFYTWIVPRPALARSRGYWSVTLRQLALLHRQLLFWRFTEAARRDVDCVVNANVLHYIGDRPEARPVADYLARVLDEDRAGCCDKWYLGACSFYYAVSRAYAGGVSALEPLREALAAHTERTLKEAERLASAEVALAVCALINLGHRTATVEAGVRILAGRQRQGGDWPAHALYYGGPKREWGWGSEALTTALCVEALTRYSAGARGNGKIVPAACATLGGATVESQSPPP